MKYLSLDTNVKMVFYYCNNMSGQEKEPQTDKTKPQGVLEATKTIIPDHLAVLRAYGLRPGGLPRRDAGIPPTRSHK